MWHRGDQYKYDILQFSLLLYIQKVLILPMPDFQITSPKWLPRKYYISLENLQIKSWESWFGDL